MKKILSMLLIVVMVGCLCSCVGGNGGLAAFHEKVSESQELLDAVADDIYSNWHDAIYDDAFDGDIDTAVFMAQIDHSEDLTRIEELDAEITELFKSLKEGKNGAMVKQVMSAYSDYYEFVVNVSGSFNSYSADKETLKKELASLLKDLSYEL